MDLSIFIKNMSDLETPYPTKYASSAIKEIDCISRSRRDGLASFIFGLRETLASGQVCAGDRLYNDLKKDEMSLFKYNFPVLFEILVNIDEEVEMDAMEKGIFNL
jgi:hypothetical protein